MGAPAACGRRQPDARHHGLPRGRESLPGTNPAALDIATPAASCGTVKAYALVGETMAEGWMIDA